MNTQPITNHVETPGKPVNLNKRQIALLRRSLFVLKPRVEAEPSTASEVDELNKLLATVDQSIS